MAAATQYASVPGIAVDQPVMYETVEREEQEESSSAGWGDKEVQGSQNYYISLKILYSMKINTISIKF